MWQHMFSVSPHSTHYSHTKHVLPHNHDGLIILFKFLNISIVFNISNIKEIKNSLKMIS
jgi:hypothetical protein